MQKYEINSLRRSATRRGLTVAKTRNSGIWIITRGAHVVMVTSAVRDVAAYISKRRPIAA